MLCVHRPTWWYALASSKSESSSRKIVGGMWDQLCHRASVSTRTNQCSIVQWRDFGPMILLYNIYIVIFIQIPDYFLLVDRIFTGIELTSVKAELEGLEPRAKDSCPTEDPARRQFWLWSTQPAHNHGSTRPVDDTRGRLLPKPLTWLSSRIRKARAMDRRMPRVGSTLLF